ncbi:hypothetical protein BST61_g3760 [Cercospora zeina]
MGGYDRAAFEPSNIGFPLAFAGSRSLTARLKNLVITNTLQGTLSPPIESAGLNMSIDSTVAQIWLPGSICDTLSDALGLQYDNNTELYFVNSTTHQSLLGQAPEFTFTLAAAASPNATTNIVLPYAAFDQQIGQPWSIEDTTYFPIRRAANESQFVLGRTFLQEAYLVVDWERENFTLGQSLHRPGVSNDIVTIESVTREGTWSKMSVGVIAGIAVGAVLLIAAICGGIWLYRRKKRRERRARDDAADAEARARTEAAVDMYPPDKKDPIGEHEGDAELPGHSRPNKLEAELMAEYRHEMPSPHKEKDNVSVSERPELYGGDSAQLLGSNEIYELPAHEIAKEMDAPASGEASERNNPQLAAGGERPPDGSPVPIGVFFAIGDLVEPISTKFYDTANYSLAADERVNGSVYVSQDDRAPVLLDSLVANTSSDGHDHRSEIDWILRQGFDWAITDTPDLWHQRLEAQGKRNISYMIADGDGL